MNYTLELNNRPFGAIKNGRKTVEGRTPTSFDKTSYDKIVSGDIITFVNNSTSEKIIVKVIYVKHYADVRSMLESEGIENVLSSGGTVKQGIENYNSLAEYEKSIQEHGIFAIKIKLHSK